VSTYSLALPELERIGATGTVFVISDLVEKKWQDQPVMSSGMLQSLSSRGWEIGSHTRTHPNLTELSDSQINVELRDSKEHLEAITHTKITSLSYPFNAQNNRIKAIAAKYYKFARVNRHCPPLRVNSSFPRDCMQVNAVSKYDGSTVIPLLFYLAKRIGYRPRGITKPSPRQGLEARFVRKWLQSLRKDQWLVLTFHNIHTDKSPNPQSIHLEEFREIVKIVDQLAEVVNFGRQVQA